ncbi:MAG: FAD-dependent oxidoreductase [Pseudomonadales bacterium]|nr:FAD-dependent oxidoreductase [Pseudomonadales bacterium]
MADPVVIIGTGLAGYNVAKEFRKYDTETPLQFITSDDGRSYSKPMISTGFTKGKSADELAMADAGAMAEQLKASIRTLTKVTAINTDAHEICIGDEIIKYSKLVLATGSYCIPAPVSGDAEELIYSVNDLMDYAAFTKAIEGKKKVLIIGAGLIGCEYSNDLANGGFEIEAVDPLPAPLGTLLPEAASRAVQRALETEKGVKFHFGTVVETINKKGDGVIATLKNGETIEADIVLSAIGVRARIDLAQAAGLETNRGIVVNRKLETSAADVYAIGDCAEVEGHLLYYVMPLMTCARALGQTLAGTPAEVSYSAMPVGIKTPVCPIQVSPAPRDVEGRWEIEEDGNNVKALFKDASGNLLGFALTGDFVKEKMALQKELPAILP